MSRTFGLLDLCSTRTLALLYDPASSAPSLSYDAANGISAKLKQVNWFTFLSPLRINWILKQTRCQWESSVLCRIFSLIFTKLPCTGREQFHFLEPRSLNPNKAGLFEDIFFWGGSIWPPPLSYFKKNLSNINITIQLLNNLIKGCWEWKMLTSSVISWRH